MFPGSSSSGRLHLRSRQTSHDGDGAARGNFNLPNHAQFSNPAKSVNSAFGMITSALPVERQIRVGLRSGF